ncbi:MAG TPA: GNAT family N-acetyltransferase [Acetobacteraceae bacterium]|nr:GNAT family N-acetyltransferase [Acetobacteraceae bacterium]
MSSSGGVLPLTYRQLGRAELDVVGRLEFDAGQMERFLGPLADIIAAVRRGLAHQMVAIEQAGELVGFFVIHPDRRNGRLWWLGWFAIDRRRQGAGLGLRAMQAIMLRLRRIPECREVRLLVAPDNAPALRLYGRAGFLVHGVAEQTGELIMRCLLAAGRPSSEVPARFWANAILVQVIAARICRMGVPASALLHGSVAHPP